LLLIFFSVQCSSLIIQFGINVIIISWVVNSVMKWQIFLFSSQLTHIQNLYFSATAGGKRRRKRDTHTLHSSTVDAFNRNAFYKVYKMVTFNWSTWLAPCTHHLNKIMIWNIIRFWGAKIIIIILIISCTICLSGTP
jgi:hypothetical protein